MSTRNRIFIALALIAIPVLIRLLYFYQAPYSNPNVAKPDYTNNLVQDPPTPSSQVVAAVSSPTGKVVVIDNFHSNMFEPSEIEPLVTAISARGANVEFDSGAKQLEMELKYASAYIVFAPSTPFSGDELRIIQQFVASGGRLLVFADPTRALMMYDAYGNPASIPDVNYTNPVIASFGLTIVNDYLYNLESNEGNFRNVKFTEFAASPLTKDLKMVVLYGAHSIHAEKGSALVTGSEKTFSSLTDRGTGLTPIALSSNGQVLAAGDFSFITNPFNQVADNALLLAHIADFAVQGERSPALVNFPFVFQRPVSLITTGKVELTSPVLEPVASLQRALKAINIPVAVRSEIAKDGDSIILGTYDLGTDLTTYLQPFKVNLENKNGAINIPGFGMVGNTGSGILLFNHGPKSNTLVLLAATVTDLPRLISLVASGDLSACVLQENIAVCNLVPPPDSSGYSDYSTPTDIPSATETPPAGSETPTPSG